MAVSFSITKDEINVAGVSSPDAGNNSNDIRKARELLPKSFLLSEDGHGQALEETFGAVTSDETDDHGNSECHFHVVEC